jgi:hypothetical protein
VDDCVRAAFDLAFAAETKMKGLNYLGTDPHLLQRSLVPASDFAVDVECRARWGYSPIERLRNRLRLRSRFRNAMGPLLGARRKS